MKLVDKKGKLFGKINIIDLAVILIIILLIIGTYFKFFRLNQTSVTQTMVPIKYDIKIEGSRDLILDALQEGDTLYDQVSGNSVGVIERVVSEPAKQSIILADGTFKICDVPNRYDVTLTVAAEAIQKDRAYFVNRSYELLMHTNKRFKTKYSNVTGKVMNIYE